MKRIVIVGGGQAGGQIALSLRRGGFGGELVMITDEDQPPYQRPPLSKLYLSGALGAERLHFPPAAARERLGLDLRCGRRAMGLDITAHSLGLDDGSIVSYDGLALALGASPIRLDLPGAELTGVHYLRSLSDADAIRASAAGCSRVVVVGAGYIGLEVAATLRSLGAEVDVLERAARILPRVGSEASATWIERRHADHGVSIHTAAEVVALQGKDGRVSAVETSDGQLHPAELVVIGVGVRPNVALASEAGLACDNGIVVDEYARTDDPDIVAAGDCSNHPNALLGTRLRLESVHNALEQARTAAASLLGEAQPYQQTPWFWSDQYDCKWQVAGLAQAPDEVLVTEGDNTLLVCLFGDGQLQAVETVNRPRDHLAARQLLNAQAKIDPDAVRRVDFDLQRLVAAHC